MSNYDNDAMVYRVRRAFEMAERKFQYEVVNLGVEFPDCFRGFGAICTEYENSVYGIGDSFNEALEDAIEQMATGSDVSVELLDAIMKSERLSVEDDNTTVVSVQYGEDVDYESIPYWHVGIRWNS